jgi:cholesterol transport system auxiliary component
MAIEQLAPRAGGPRSPRPDTRLRGSARERRLAAAVLLVLQLLGCSTPAVVNRYDFGLPAAAPAAPADTGTLAATADIEVSAPAWLDTPAVVYRLAYADAGEVHAYAQTQWVAPPARLVEQLLRQAAAGAPACGPGLARNPAAPALRLDVELLEFSQVFATPQASTVALRARARLLALPGRAVLAQRDFDLRTATSPADATGAVHGLRDIAATFAGEVLPWAVGVAPQPCIAPAEDARPVR